MVRGNTDLSGKKPIQHVSTDWKKHLNFWKFKTGWEKKNTLKIKDMTLTVENLWIFKLKLNHVQSQPKNKQPNTLIMDILRSSSSSPQGPLRAAVPNFLAPGTGFVEDDFSMELEWDGFGMIQAHYIYCALHFYYYYISSTSDPRGWGPLSYSIMGSILGAITVAKTCLQHGAPPNIQSSWVLEGLFFSTVSNQLTCHYTGAPKTLPMTPS